MKNKKIDLDGANSLWYAKRECRGMYGRDRIAKSAEVVLLNYLKKRQTIISDLSIAAKRLEDDLIRFTVNCDQCRALL